MDIRNPIANRDDLILITGANGFLGTRVVNALLRNGYVNLRCFVKKSTDVRSMVETICQYSGSRVDVMEGDLARRGDCQKAVSSAALIYHLAAGFGKSYRHIYRNTVAATRNLLDAAVEEPSIRRFASVSSFTVYSTANLKKGQLLDENCEIYSRPELKGEAYCCGKVRQEELVLDYHRDHGLPYVFVRPGYVFGPGKSEISGRVGLMRGDVFLNFGGSNPIPLTYVDNCADAFVLAGLTGGADGQAFNIVDDELPTGTEFLNLYRENVKNIRSISVPKTASYLLCLAWENMSRLSRGKLPPTFNLRRWSDDWKGNPYSNEKAKRYLGWRPDISLEDACRHYFDFCREQTGNGS
ncbi:MAG: NAD-dependent epimerase/dehydratase family protein [bacterium]|nr:MAG: NAD-dependent epimerase/dehydratase family protein [bacterium]